MHRLWTLLLFLAVTPQLSYCGGSQSYILGVPSPDWSLLAVLLTLGAVATGLALILVQFDANISILGFAVSSLVLMRAFSLRTPSQADILSAVIAAFIWLGCLFAAGFLYATQISLLRLLIVGGTGGICFMAYSGWSTRELRPKIGIYTVTIILSYELWLLMRALVPR